MASPLWTDRHAPTLEELPQDHLREYLQRASDRPINLLLHGPPGAGKTAAVRALANETHADPDTNLIVINVADFFNRTKREIRDDPRFAGFLRGSSRLSKREMINHVFREMVAHAPISGRFRTVLLDNAEAVREDFQQALRRLIERHHETTQFVLTTRQLGRIIPALQSRCLPVPVPPPSDEAIRARLATIFEREGFEIEPAALELLVGRAKGNMRSGILAAQSTAVELERQGAAGITEEIVFEALRSGNRDDAFERLLSEAEGGNFGGARSILDELLIDQGLDGGEILEKLATVGRTRYEANHSASFANRVAEADFYLATGGDDRIQLSWLLAQVGVESPG